MPRVLIGNLDTQVVGCNHYRASKPRSKGVVLSFKRSPDNPYDGNAIAVHKGEACTKKTHIGHLPRDVAKMLAPWMDKGAVVLTGLSAGACDDYTVPAAVAVLAVQSHAEAVQKWLAKVAYGFRPVKIAPAAQQAAAAKAGSPSPAEAAAAAATGMKRKQRAAAPKTEQGAAKPEAAGAADERQVKCGELKHSSQGSAAPLLGSQEEPVEDDAPAAPTVNLLPANIELGSKQVFHGGVCLSFDDQGAATISGTKCTLLEGMLRTWPVLQRRSPKACKWTSPPLDDLERYFLARALQHMAPLAAGQPMPAPYPEDLIIPLRFRPCADDGTPLVGPMTSTSGRRQNGGRQYFAARGANTPRAGRWVWADGSVPRVR